MDLVVALELRSARDRGSADGKHQRSTFDHSVRAIGRVCEVKLAARGGAAANLHVRSVDKHVDVAASVGYPSGGRVGSAVSYTHLTLPTICSV